MAFTLPVGDIIQYLRPGEMCQIRGNTYADITWQANTAAPTEQELLDAELAAAKAKRIEQVKVEAQKRIFAAVPQWKQNNLARGVYDASTTSSLNSSIDTIRTDSNTAESDINALTTVAAVLSFTW